MESGNQVSASTLHLDAKRSWALASKENEKEIQERIFKKDVAFLFSVSKPGCPNQNTRLAVAETPGKYKNLKGLLTAT